MPQINADKPESLLNLQKIIYDKNLYEKVAALPLPGEKKIHFILTDAGVEKYSERLIGRIWELTSKKPLDADDLEIILKAHKSPKANAYHAKYEGNNIILSFYNISLR